MSTVPKASSPRCDALKREGLDKAVQAKTGLVVDPYFSATKIEWLLDNVAGLRARAERGELAFGTVDTWLAALGARAQ
ncbi:MAG TPA: FGGY family carbohydrate kinase, partial [Burkholderiales bacterium]|nr:FGGY family carbohydrate kinase [Burkholderiales bacterium]